MKREILTLALAFGALVASAQTTEKINIEDGERWWVLPPAWDCLCPMAAATKQR